MLIVGEVLLLAPHSKLTSKFSVYLNMLSWGLSGTVFSRTVIKFSHLFVSLYMSFKNHGGHGGKLEMGILGPQCPAMS